MLLTTIAASPLKVAARFVAYTKVLRAAAELFAILAIPAHYGIEIVNIFDERLDRIAHSGFSSLVLIRQHEFEPTAGAVPSGLSFATGDFIHDRGDHADLPIVEAS